MQQVQQVLYQIHKVKEDLLEQMELTEPMELMERKVHLDLLGVVNPSNAYVVWQDNTPGNTEIFLTSSQSFGTPINLSNNTGQSFFPAIATSGNNNVYVAWQDDNLTPNRFDVLFAASNNNGTSFGTPINLSNNIGFSGNPQIAAVGNNVYVTWTDTTPGSQDILFAASNNNSTSFGTPINLSNNAGSSFGAQIAVSGNNVYVTWFDNTPGDFDIFVITNAQPFGTPVNIGTNPGTSQSQQIAVS